MWWWLALGALLTVAAEQAGGYVWRRWWMVDTKGRKGKQVSYWS